MGAGDGHLLESIPVSCESPARGRQERMRFLNVRYVTNFVPPVGAGSGLKMFSGLNFLTGFARGRGERMGSSCCHWQHDSVPPVGVALTMTGA